MLRLAKRDQISIGWVPSPYFTKQGGAGKAILSSRVALLRRREIGDRSFPLSNAHTARACSRATGPHIGSGNMQTNKPNAKMLHSLAQLCGRNPSLPNQTGLHFGSSPRNGVASESKLGGTVFTAERAADWPAIGIRWFCQLKIYMGKITKIAVDSTR